MAQVMYHIALLLLAASPFCLASGQKYLFSFGDSYTDTGFDINGTQPSPNNPMGNPPYPSHTSSGGPNYIDFLTVTYNSSLVLSYNFAMSGATTSNNIVAAVDPDIHSFQQQVYYDYNPKYSTPGAKNAPWVPDDSIFLIFFGINDIDLSYQSDSFAEKVPAVLNAYFSYIEMLHAFGSRKFLFVNVPPFNRSPPRQARGAQDAANCAKSIGVYNRQLAQRLEDWKIHHADSETTLYDFHYWMTEVLNIPQTYGFKNANCEGDGDSDCIWWAPGPLHTTSHFQRLLAQDMIASFALFGWYI